MTTKINSNNISSTGVLPGTYKNSIITVNEQGQITSAITGQKIPVVTSVTITDTNWVPIDDLNADITSANLRILGDQFEPGCQVLFNNLLIPNISFLNFTRITTSSRSLSNVLDFSTTTDLTVGMLVTGTGIPAETTIVAKLSSTRIQLSNNLTTTVPSGSIITFSSNNELLVIADNIPTGQYTVSVINPQGAVGVKPSGITFGPKPVWNTSNILPAQNQLTNYSQQLSATDATIYTVESGSSLPGSLTLTTSGLLSGTLPGITQNTTYTFTIRATDAQLQESLRTFSLTVYRGPATATISPAVSGKTSWDFNTDGPLNFTTDGSWTLTPTSNFYGYTRVWGAGGGGGGGGGGYAYGIVYYQNSMPYLIVVGSGGNYGVGTAGGTGGTGVGTGGTGGSTGIYVGGAGGGAGSGVFQPASISQANAILIGGGGGGQSTRLGGGGGGGTTGSTGSGSGAGGGVEGGAGGSQTAAGSGGINVFFSGPTPGTSGSGMNGGNGGNGGSLNYNGFAGGGGGAGYWGGGGGGGNATSGGASTAVPTDGGGGGASGRVSTNTSLVTETYLETAVGSTPANSTNPVKFSTAGVGGALSGSKGGSGQIYIST